MPLLSGLFSKKDKSTSNNHLKVPSHHREPKQPKPGYPGGRYSTAIDRAAPPSPSKEYVLPDLDLPSDSNGFGGSQGTANSIYSNASASKSVSKLKLGNPFRRKNSSPDPGEYCPPQRTLFLVIQRLRFCFFDEDHPSRRRPRMMSEHQATAIITNATMLKA